MCRLLLAHARTQGRFLNCHLIKRPGQHPVDAPRLRHLIKRLGQHPVDAPRLCHLIKRPGQHPVDAPFFCLFLLCMFCFAFVAAIHPYALYHPFPSPISLVANRQEVRSHPVRCDLATAMVAWGRHTRRIEVRAWVRRVIYNLLFPLLNPRVICIFVQRHLFVCY